MSDAVSADGQPRQVRKLPTPKVSKDLGKQARDRVPLAAHAELGTIDRDAVAILRAQEATRLPNLVPIRYGRMLTSPFAFFRGAAAVMAADLDTTRSTSLSVQLCGDAHLHNFGGYASRERRLVFDVNDFDETLPGPFEWDVKRLAASFVLAAAENGLDPDQGRQVALVAAASYRQAVRQFADRALLDVWYADLELDAAAADYEASMRATSAKGKPTKQDKASIKKLSSTLEKARRRDRLQAVAKMTEVVDGRRRIRDQAPLMVPLASLDPGMSDHVWQTLSQVVETYVGSLSSEVAHLVGQYQMTDIALKVVGVGSVGTRAWVLLLETGNPADTLLLQAKQALGSVLEPYLGAASQPTSGQRVVAGQRLIQSSSDIFLGWLRHRDPDGIERDYYLRQLRDWKISADVSSMGMAALGSYAQLCGRTLARAHSRSGDRIALASYLGKSSAFEEAIATYAREYAAINQADYDALRVAVERGEVSAILDL